MKTFSIVKRKDEKEYGEYRTKRVILEIYDEMKWAMETGVPYETRLEPSQADAAARHEGKEKGRCRTIYQRKLRAYFAASKSSTRREREQWNLSLMNGLTGS